MAETVCKMLEGIAEKICDDYCKYPDQYNAAYKDPDDASNKLAEEHCNGCPLMRL